MRSHHHYELSFPANEILFKTTPSHFLLSSIKRHSPPLFSVLGMHLKKSLSNWKWISLCPDWHWRNTLVLNTTSIKQPLPQSPKQFKEWRSLINLNRFLCLMILFRLGLLRDTHTFLLSSSTPFDLLGQGFLEKYRAGSSFSWKGEIILEFHSSNQNSQVGKSDDPQHLLSAMFLMAPRANSKDTNHLSLLDHLPPSWVNPKLILAESTVHLLLRSK